jgi:hypothetical protein
MHAADPVAGRLRRRRLPTLGTSFVLALACSSLAAAQASAATLAVVQPCVVNADASVGSPMTVTGTGFTPGDTIELQTTSGGGFGSALADASGNISAVIAAPLLSTLGPSVKTFTLTASDSLTPLPVDPTTTFPVANLAVGTNPTQAKPTKRVTWTFTGFPSGAKIYAHYVHGKKAVARAAFGRAGGPCGVLKKKAVLFPGHAKFELYTVQVDIAPHYSPSTRPAWIGMLNTHIPL